MGIPEVVEISTGEVKIGEGRVILSAGALGSCIAVVVYDVAAGRGGVAHVMLPGRSARPGDPKRLRFAEDAIKELLDGLRQRGTIEADLRVCLAGGANVLERPDDTICAGNIASVRATLAATGLVPIAESLGGVIRRRVRLLLPFGRVECAIGNDPFLCLWKHSDDSSIT